MGIWLSEREQRLVAGAEAASAATPIPTQIVSNGEYLPPPQSATQKRVEARIDELADANAKRLGLDRRQFLRTSCGMAAAFVAMNEIYGGMSSRSTPAEARRPRAGAGPRRRASPASSSSTSRPISCATTSTTRSSWTWPSSRTSTGTRSWSEGVDSLARYKFQNFVKEVFYDSDTSLALLSGAPFDDPDLVVPVQRADRARRATLINDFAGSRRLLAHAVITPKQPGWMDEVDKAIAGYKPESLEGLHDRRSAQRRRSSRGGSTTRSWCIRSTTRR